MSNDSQFQAGGELDRPSNASASAVEHRNGILELERAMFNMPEDQRIEFETRHYFAEGLYAREIVIPAGSVLTGKIHRREHLNIVSKGRILVATEEGQREIVAPCTFVALPGTKRAGYAIEETVWTTIHAACETDIEKLEAELIAPTFEELSLPRWRKALKGMLRIIRR